MPESAESARSAGSSRKTFGPVVLLGLAAGALAAVAGTRAWVQLSGSNTDSGGAMASTLEVSAPGEMPLAAALSLVLLACWGVVLVTRGRVRRAVAGLGAVTALGLLVTTITAFFSLPDSFQDSMRSVLGDVEIDSTFTGWYPAALAAAVVSVLATLAAARFTPGWPEMGARYDAPSGDGPSGARKNVEPEGNIELWKALDEGHDPTESERPLD